MPPYRTIPSNEEPLNFITRGKFNLSKQTPVLVGLYVKFYVQIQHFWVSYVTIQGIERTTTVKQQNLIV
jgi:hypothetical protein